MSKQLCKYLKLYNYPRPFFPSLLQTQDFSKYFAKYFELEKGVLTTNMMSISNIYYK